jgi:bifunctional DNase/RNase
VDTKVKLTVQGLTNSRIQSGIYALVLTEEEGERQITITVGVSEAQSIAMALEHITPPRPLTHDLMVALLQVHDIHLLEVYIHQCTEDVFYAELLVEKDGDLSRLDSRTSDAVALAIRMKCNIYTTEDILENCGVELDPFALFDDAEEEDEEEAEEEDEVEEDDITLGIEPSDIQDEEQLKRWLSMLQESDIQYRIKEAVATENYEDAKIYQDELTRREQEDKK